MKKIFLLAILSLIFNSAYCQKKKTAKKSDAIALAKLGTVAIEISKNNFYLVNKTDTIAIKQINPTALPTNCKIVTFKAKNIPLYLVSWTEISNSEVPKKVTATTISYSKIYDFVSKTEVLSNQQTNTNIKEQVQLGKTTASETQERNRNEGYTLTLLPTGDVNLKNKTQEKKMSFDVASKLYK